MAGSQQLNILIVDDDEPMCFTLGDILAEDHFKVDCVSSIAQASEELKKRFYNVVLVDLKLPDGTGLGLLPIIKKANEHSETIIFTGYASLESAVSALNEGAFAYIQKPLNIDELKISIKRALQIQRLTLDNKRLLNKLKELSLKDTHTELYNYRYLMERLSTELERAKRYVIPLSILLIDIDYFKSINDVYGHQYGDRILKEFARYLLHSVRSSDVVTRYGGEEFVIILPDTNKENAVVFGERLLEDTERHNFEVANNSLKLKISIGIASFPEDGLDPASVSGLVDLADRALTFAKESGGDRLASLEGIPEPKGIIVDEAAQENVGRLKKKLTRMEERVNQTILESIYAFAKTIEAKDYHTIEHGEHMVALVAEMGAKLDLPTKMLENLKHAAMLHDLGKIGIPDEILHKPGPLTEEEYTIIKRHPQIGAEVIRPIHFLKELVPIILYHHERFDGLGYSAGLRGKEIPLGARVIALADVYHALITDRPYRKAYSKEEALCIIQEGSGTQFDPEILEVFMKVIHSGKF